MELPKILKLDKKGLVLTEILVALGILVIITSFGLFLSMDFLRGYSFNYERNLLINILQKTRSKAMANINQSKHGFYFDNTNKNYIIFQGESFNLREPSFDENYPAGKQISISNLPAEGIIFQQLSGDSLPVDITISDGVKSAIISINNEGRINW